MTLHIGVPLGDEMEVDPAEFAKMLPAEQVFEEMLPYLDIFRVECSGVLWCGAVTTVETAQERIQKLACSSPGST